MLELVILGTAASLVGLTLWKDWLSVTDLFVPDDPNATDALRLRPVMRRFVKVGGLIFATAGFTLLASSVVKLFDHILGA
ncbi:hypothetical protein [Streptomyces lycii]|uniref:DUF1146 domain-containing protein n=1 Tax=Streptomyces lycii TaxID=2654337 RepID=A0ABQ7FIX1_9ACTN|nr:hypothetical protein [Streptomyces lycii]KAF4408916.1 hypothetical protein GCU69_11565 [Streptomyces lycii]